MSLLDGKKTYIGIIIAVVPTLASFFGYTVGDVAEVGTLLSTLAGNVETISVTLGGLIAWYGRSVTKA